MVRLSWINREAKHAIRGCRPHGSAIERVDLSKFPVGKGITGEIEIPCGNGDAATLLQI